MRILVTGATGFIGPHVVAHLAGRGHEVVSSSRAAAGPIGAAIHFPHDFAGRAQFPEVGPLDAVVHLAGNGNVQQARQDPVPMIHLNTQGTVVALEVARRAGAQFVFASTQRVYALSNERPRIREDAPTEPSEPYGASKLAAEALVQGYGRAFGVSGSILRCFTVYGPGQVVSSGISGVVAIFGQAALTGKPLLAMARQQKDYVEIRDVVRAIELALTRPTTPPHSYNVGTGMPVSLLDLAHAVRRAAGSDSAIVEDYREGDLGPQVADVTRARAELGYEPRISLDEGLGHYVDWLRTARPHPPEG
ncbi:MAG: UDP-glucose 4-epimerase [Chloroflexota bacterium]|nr:UDP-glucose 4-epimerase [Chloroflexota bacterium]